MTIKIIPLALLTLLTTGVLYAADPTPSGAGTDTLVAAAPVEAGTVIVTVDGLKSTEGLLYASLFLAADGFPDALDKAFANQSVSAATAAGGKLVLTFENVPAGNLGLSIFHDANSDGKLDTNFLGIPQENYGFSQNPPSRFGPPSFDEATVALVAGETKQLVITLK